MKERIPTGKLGQDHITEYSDLAPSPEAVYSPTGHLKQTFIERYAQHDSEMSLEQKFEVQKHIFSHDHGCEDCKSKLRRAQGKLPTDFLPFEEEEKITDLKNSR
jgi:hypothetical protein